jgi:tellurite resistance protein TehA-like permease
MGFTRKLNVQALPDSKKENLITALYVGFIFILLAVLYFINVHVNLWGNFVNFMSAFTLATVPGTSISLPVPATPSAYTMLYNVGFQFCLGLGVLEIAILALRIWLNSPFPRKAETIENIVFWLGSSYLVVTYLVNITIPSEWFVFWAGIILIAGLSLVARAFVLMAKR